MSDDRTVSVNLRMQVRDYIAGGNQAIAMNKQLQASQRDLGNDAGKTASQLTKLGDSAQSSGQKMGAGLKYGALGLGALGAAGGGLKALPPLLAATATGAAVLPQVFLGSAVAGGVLKTAVSGVGDALKEVNKQKDPFKGLAPSARALVSEYQRVQPALKGFQQGISDRALKGTAQGLDMLATQTLPKLSGGLGKIADDWSDLFAEIALNANSPEAIGAFNTITDTADDFFDGINDRIRPIGQSISTLITSADPVARAFGDELMGMIDRFTAAVARAKANGSLAELFAGGTEAARELASITGSVLRITGMVIKEANATNSATQSAGTSLRAYVESGRAAGDVAGVVHTLTTAWEGLRDVLGPIGVLMRDAVADPGTAASVQVFFQVLAAGSQTLTTVLTVLLALNGATGGVLLALVGLALAASKMAAAINLGTAAATRGAAALTRYGAAGAVAGKGLQGVAGGAGKLVGALFALEAAHQIFEMFAGDAVNVQELDRSIENLAKTGAMAGELTRLFGDGLSDLGTQAKMATDDNFFANFLRDAEKAVPLAGDLAEALGSDTFSGSAENFAALDTAIASYAQKTNDAAGATELWQQVLSASGLDTAQLQKLLPGASAELTRLQSEAHAAGSGMQGLAERTALLNAPLREAVTLGRSLLDVFNELNGGNIAFAKAQIAAEEAVDQLTKGLDENGLALNRQKTGFDINTEKGRQNLNLTLGLAEAGAKAAQARLDEGGTIEQAAGVYDGYINRLRTALAVQGATPAQINALIGSYTQVPTALQAAGDAATSLNGKLNSIPKGATFRFNGQSLVDGNGKTIELKDGIKGIPQGKKFTWNGNSLVDGKGKVYAVKAAVQALPPSKSIKLSANTGQALSNVRTLQGVIGAVNSKTVTLTVRTNTSSANAAEHAMNSKARGGMVLRKAAAGLLEPEIAPPGTRYQWAEPETGGELFVPRKGIQKARGQALIGVAAQWYDMQAVPMANGGIRAAASGLVNVAPPTSSSGTGRTATKLDFAEAYLRARDAVKSLNTSLKENGRSFSLSTAKGRENRSALYSAISAAQAAAKTKYEETGSVAAANKVYDEHIRRLKATLKQQKVNSATIRSLLALAQRPTYDLPEPAKPKNSLTNIAYAKASIAGAAAIDDLKDSLSLNKATTSLGSAEGRENLGNIIGFLETASSAAQAKFDQTKNAKQATAVYDGYVKQLRVMLMQAGYSAKTIQSLIATYGKITLTPNLRGGVYMAAGGLASLDKAAVFPGTGATMYGFAEPQTGGELFVPRNGDRQRGRDLLSVGAGWYGGRFVASNSKQAAASYDYSTHMTVHALTYNPSTAELIGYQRQIDAQARVGRRY